MREFYHFKLGPDEFEKIYDFNGKKLLVTQRYSPRTRDTPCHWIEIDGIVKEYHCKTQSRIIDREKNLVKETKISMVDDVPEGDEEVAKSLVKGNGMQGEAYFFFGSKADRKTGN